MQYSYKINENDVFFNVKDVLKSYFLVSSRLFSKLQKNNFIFLNGNVCSANDLVYIGDIVSFSMDFYEDSSNILPTKMNLDIIYEDDSVLIVNKPANIAVHPTSYHFNDTLSNGIKYYFDSINLHKKIRIVNRLDRNTSGIVVIAKNEYVQEFLIKQMSSFTLSNNTNSMIHYSNISNSFKKKYIGIVEENFKDLRDFLNNSNNPRNVNKPNNFYCIANAHNNLNDFYCNKNLYYNNINDTFNGITNLHYEDIDDTNKIIANITSERRVLAGTINLPISRKEGSIIERCVSPLRRKSYYSF